MARILITGATGLIGGKLASHFEGLGHEVVRMGTSAHGRSDVTVANLALWDQAWVNHFKGIDCVINLAACARPDAGWSEIERLNLDLAGNVYEAAAQNGVARLIFASSNWVVAGHRADDLPLTGDMEPAPVNPYGMSKLAGERQGYLYSVARGLSIICLRIGFNQGRPGNEPGDHMSGGLWGQRMWLSDHDMCAGFERATFAPDSLRFAVLNLVSRNKGMRWDLKEAERLIGYVPRDGYAPVESPELVDREVRAKGMLTDIARLQAEFQRERI